MQSFHNLRASFNAATHTYFVQQRTENPICRSFLLSDCRINQQEEEVRIVCWKGVKEREEERTQKEHSVCALSFSGSKSKVNISPQCTRNGTSITNEYTVRPGDSLKIHRTTMMMLFILHKSICIRNMGSFSGWMCFSIWTDKDPLEYNWRLILNLLHIRNSINKSPIFTRITLNSIEINNTPSEEFLPMCLVRKFLE